MDKTQVYNSTPYYVIIRHTNHIGGINSEAIPPGGTFLARDPKIAWHRKYKFDPFGDNGLQVVELPDDAHRNPVKP